MYRFDGRDADAEALPLFVVLEPPPPHADIANALSGAIVSAAKSTPSQHDYSLVHSVIHRAVNDGHVSRTYVANASPPRPLLPS